MSWYIKNLIQYADSIRNNIYTESGIEVDLDLEDEDYNNLLIVEKKIKDLYESELLSTKELSIIQEVSQGKTFLELESVLDLNRNTIAKVFNLVCDKIAFILGNQFTNEGYLNYMKIKHNLSEEQIESLKVFMGI